MVIGGSTSTLPAEPARAGSQLGNFRGDEQEKMSGGRDARGYQGSCDGTWQVLAPEVEARGYAA